MTDDLQKKIVSAIEAQLNEKTSLDEAFFNMVLLRLEYFGYTVVESDSWLIAFVIEKCEWHHKNICHISAIPDGLKNNLCDLVCGEFLNQVCSSTYFKERFDLGRAVQSVQAGDTTVTFKDGLSDEDKFATLVNYLIHGKEGELVCYRRLKW